MSSARSSNSHLFNFHPFSAPASPIRPRQSQKLISSTCQIALPGIPTSYVVSASPPEDNESQYRLSQYEAPTANNGGGPHRSRPQPPTLKWGCGQKRREILVLVGQVLPADSLQALGLHLLAANGRHVRRGCRLSSGLGLFGQIGLARSHSTTQHFCPQYLLQPGRSPIRFRWWDVCGH
jgi:hypothetical protein